MGEAEGRRRVGGRVRAKGAAGAPPAFQPGWQRTAVQAPLRRCAAWTASAWAADTLMRTHVQFPGRGNRTYGPMCESRSPGSALLDRCPVSEWPTRFRVLI